MFSAEISDLEDPALTLAQFPRLERARFTEVTLMPGEMMFMPLAWWHQVPIHRLQRHHHLHEFPLAE